MNYLITGGTGFIGSYVCRRLLQKGHNIVIYDWLPNNNSINNILSLEDLKNVKIISGDVTDSWNLARVCKDNSIDQIIHLAALLMAEAEVNPVQAVKINVEGTLNVFEVARLLKIKRVIWGSSVTVFGPAESYREEYLDDDAVHKPTCIYGACKSFLEYFGKHYFDKYGVDTIGLRFSLVYGLGRQRGGGQFINELVNKPAIGEPGVVPYGDDIVDWIYVEDAAKAIVCASQAKTTLSRSFIIKGDLRTIKEVAGYVKSILPEADIVLKPGTIGIAWKYRTQKAEKELGYSPEWKMERGIHTVINDIRKERGLTMV